MKKKISGRGLVVKTAAFSALLTLSLAVGANAQNAKNVILLIADGMGHNEKQLATYLAGEPLSMDAMPITGAMSNWAADNICTDSAAAATALATGIKTNNGMLSVTPKKASKATILEKSRDNGKATGLVATSTITHATPAAFGSHVDGRGDEGQIAAQMVTEKIDVMFGGGYNYFLPKSKASTRKDERNLIDELKNAGYSYITDAESLKTLQAAPALGLFAPDKMAPDFDRDNTTQPSISEMTSKAIELLSKDPDGFFLMVEGSQVDWGGHDNDPAYDLTDLIAFDKAVGVARDFAAKNPDTLVVVCADHETGGISLVKGNASWAKFNGLKKQTASGEFIAAAIGEENDIEKIKEIVKQYTGLTLKDSEAKSLVAPKDRKSKINKLVSTRAGITWATGDHTGSPVPILAQGAGQELFSGWFDNTEVPKRIAKAMGIEL